MREREEMWRTDATTESSFPEGFCVEIFPYITIDFPRVIVCNRLSIEESLIWTCSLSALSLENPSSRRARFLSIVSILLSKRVFSIHRQVGLK